MATGRLELRSHRGWLVIAGLTLVLAVLVGTQALPALANADRGPAAAPRTSSPSVVPGSGAAATPATSAASADAAATPAARSATRSRALVPAARAKAAVLVKAARPAGATSADVCAGPDWQVRRGQLALATLRDTGQRSGVTVAFLPARTGYLGLTYPARRHVDVFVRSCSAESFPLLRHVISHEMGHAFDAAHMTPALRAAYLAARGLPAGTPWFGCDYCSDFATPAGDFAEAYSQWQRGSTDNRSTMAPRPDAAQLAAIARTFFG